MSQAAVLGQARAKKILGGFLTARRVPQALLFHGPTGVGKTLSAEAFAAALLCGARGDKSTESCGTCASCAAFAAKTHPDFIKVDFAYQACLRQEDEVRQRSLRVDTVREARRAMETSPMTGPRKVAVVADADTLEIEAANALLKILEEPPPGAVWILTASSRERLPRTIVSRCASVLFSPLPEKDVRDILAQNGVEENFLKDAAAAAGGSAGRALALSRRGYPKALLSGRLAPLEAADALGADLPTARANAELALFALVQELRRHWRSGRISFRAAARSLGTIRELSLALRANVDPRAVVLSACLSARKALA